MTSSGRLIVRLYDRAIQDLETAVEAIKGGDPGQKGKVISHAQEIVLELLGALDMEAGGEIAVSLRSLYVYMIRQLVEANQTLSVPILEEVAGLLREVREGWEGAARQEGQATSEGQPFTQAAAKVARSV